jgi:hypothetical protein
MTPFFNAKRSVENGVQFAWDSTSISLAQTCMRKYYYKMILGLQPKNTSVHLVFGGIYAACLEHFYLKRAEGMHHEDALRFVVRKAMTDSWDFDTGAPKIFDHKAKTRPNLIRTIVWYLEQFGKENEDGLVTHHLQSGKPAVELSFTIEANDDFVFCGHLDRVVGMSGRLYVADQKTTGGTVGTYFFNQFSPDNQMSLYSWAGKSVLASPVSGVIIDAAQIAVNFTRFERGITTRSVKQLDEWYEHTIDSLYAINDLVRAGKFPMNPTACGNYGGCEFRNICSQAPSVRENYLKTGFMPHNWDPLEAR